MADRYRNWFWIAYPDSMPENWADIIIDSHVPTLVSPLHDKDIDLDGSEKKPHYHILTMYSGNKTYEQFRDDFLSPMNTSVFQVAKDLGGCARYLCHLDNSEKAEYKVKDIMEFNGADWQSVALTSREERKLIKTIMQFAYENNIYYYWDLVSYAMHCNDSWTESLINRTVFWVSALKSLKIKRETNSINIVDILVYERNS